MFNLGDKVKLDGEVVTAVHLQGESWNCELAVGDERVWIQSQHLSANAPKPATSKKNTTKDEDKE